MPGTPRPDPVSTKRQRIAELARDGPGMAFTTLAHHIDIEWLRTAHGQTRKDGRPYVVHPMARMLFFILGVSSLLVFGQGFVPGTGRIMFFHVPQAMLAFIGFLVSTVYAIRYLRGQQRLDSGRNALTSIHIHNNEKEIIQSYHTCPP